MEKAGAYRFVLHFYDDYGDSYKDHQVKPALERNQIWSVRLEEVRIVVAKDPYQDENPNTYPCEENIVVKADPNATPQYEQIYMYAVLKATVSGQGTFWFLGHHNNPAHANYPKKAILDLNGDGQAETTVQLHRWKWGNLNFTWSYIEPDWHYHSNDKDGDNRADFPFENPWTVVNPGPSGANTWRWFNGEAVGAGLKLGTTRYKVVVSSGSQVVRSPDETDTDNYGPKETVRRVVSMYAFNTLYLRWCSTFLRVNTIYASVYKQVERYVGGDCADVAVVACRKMGGRLSTYQDWWADALAKANDPELLTVNEPRAGDLVLFDINNDGIFDHTTIFAGNMDFTGNKGDKLTPDDRVIVTNFGHSGIPIHPSEWGNYAVVWGTYDMFPYLFKPDPDNEGEVMVAIPIRIRHLSQVTEHSHP
jgi:hypothetical protein